ncbi:MAG: hypothetical protein ACLFVJ_13235 [Persicimonas sp.]
MPDEDQEEPIEPIDEPTDEPSEDAGDEPEDSDVASAFGRMLGALRERAEAGPAAVRWLAAWQPLVAALHSLGVTVGKLIWRARQAHISDRAHGDDRPLIDDEARDEIDARFRALREAFPDAAELFFGVDEIDRLIGETLENPKARETVTSFARLIEARVSAVSARLVGWGLAEEGPELSLERLEGFVRGLEALLQEVLDRWVLPRLFEDLDGDK